MRIDAACIVLDTNVLVSAALLPTSASRKVLNQATNRYPLAFSDATWDELQSVLYRPKFDRYFAPSDKRMEYLRTLSRLARWYSVHCNVLDCRDPKDNKFLALAFQSQAVVIVSGDDDLLCLHPWRGIPIMTPTAFLQAP